MLDIRLEGKQPIYEQIADGIAGLISSGSMSAGEKLPTVRETAKSLGINPNTVQKAYVLLEQRGFIYSVPAKGSYVSDTKKISDALKRKACDEMKKAMTAAMKAGVSEAEAEAVMRTVWD